MSTSEKPIGLDAAIATFDRLGIAKGYAVSMPQGPSGVYMASVYPKDLAQQRVIYLDQYRGQPLLDMHYDDYGPLGRMLEWGINVHMVQQYGAWNQWGLALACAAIMLLCVSAALAWWKRRPAGGLGIPPSPRDRRALRAVLGLMAVAGVMFPLVGASLLLMLLDWGLRQAPWPQNAMR